MPLPAENSFVFYGVMLVIVLIFMAIIYFLSEYQLRLFQRRIKKALRPVFPDVSANGRSIYFQFHSQNHEFKGQIDFSVSNRYSHGSVIFHFQLLNTAQSDFYRVENNSIFELLVRERGLFDGNSNDLADFKKLLSISASNQTLKQCLASENVLFSDVQELYLAAGGPQILLRLHQNGMRMSCNRYVGNPDTVKRMVESAVKACEQAINAAARAGIDFTAPKVQDDPWHPRPFSLESRSEESFYDSLDDSSNHSPEDIFEGTAAEPASGALAVQPREKLPPPPPRRKENQSEKAREEDESMLFF